MGSDVECIFVNSLFSKRIESEYNFNARSELFINLLFFKIKFESIEVFINVEFKLFIKFPLKFKYFSIIILVLNLLPVLIIVLLIIVAF